MIRILDRLWLGNKDDIELGGDTLAILGFVAVLDLREQAHADKVKIVGGVEVAEFRFSDGTAPDSESAEAALAFVAKEIRSGRVLVACQAGMSRSVSAVVAYLVSVGHSPADAFALLKSVHPRASPFPATLGGWLRSAVSE